MAKFAGLSVVDEVGPFLQSLEKNYKKYQDSTINSGLFYISKSTKEDLKKGMAGNHRLEKISLLKKRFDNKKSNKKWKRAGLKKDATKALRKERTADRSEHKRNKGGAALNYLKNMIKYIKSENGQKATVGWVGTGSSKVQRIGRLWQKEKETNVTSDMRRHFAGLGIGIKRSTSVIKKPARDIWNNIHTKYVKGGGMQKAMEAKLQQKIKDAEERARGKAFKSSVARAS